MFGRPDLHTSYESEAQLLPTWTQKGLMGILLALLFLMPFELPIIDQIPLIRFLGDADWLRVVSRMLVFAIAALGLNILSGAAGQVSLGHAFFMGAGACTAAYVGGVQDDSVLGLGWPIWIWLPASAIIPALIGMLVAPVATRLRGLYLAIVTLGLVFLGIHLGTMSWGRKIAGAQQVGRDAPTLDIRLWKEETPLIDMSNEGQWLWFTVTEAQKRYLFFLVLLIVAVVLSKNILRSRTGRAFAAIRDRDIAAEVMGVPEAKYKTLAFALSSAFAGVAGALLTTISGTVLSDSFNLFLSVEFVAILLIGGIGSTAGVLVGTFVVVLLPRFVESLTHWLEGADAGISGAVSDFILTEGRGGDFGIISTGLQTQGWQLSVFDWNLVLFGALVIVFLIFEPLGLFGVWIRVRNYWKRWPFGY